MAFRACFTSDLVTRVDVLVNGMLRLANRTSTGCAMPSQSLRVDNDDDDDDDPKAIPPTTLKAKRS